MQARTFLGLCQFSMGDIQLGACNYERVLREDPNNLEAAVYLAQARKEVRPQRKLCPSMLDTLDELERGLQHC